MLKRKETADGTAFLEYNERQTKTRTGAAVRQRAISISIYTLDQWVTTQQACRDELVVYSLFFPQQDITIIAQQVQQTP